VIDSGIGIDRKDQNKIFQLFVQIDSGLNRQFTGSGLDLSIMKRILLAYDADLGVQSMNPFLLSQRQRIPGP
jgi:signal transduction histidine kinase